MHVERDRISDEHQRRNRAIDLGEPIGHLAHRAERLHNALGAEGKADVGEAAPMERRQEVEVGPLHGGAVDPTRQVETARHHAKPRRRYAGSRLRLARWPIARRTAALRYGRARCGHQAEGQCRQEATQPAGLAWRGQQHRCDPATATPRTISPGGIVEQRVASGAPHQHRCRSGRIAPRAHPFIIARCVRNDAFRHPAGILGRAPTATRNLAIDFFGRFFSRHFVA
jgi:hypothetical protein